MREMKQYIDNKRTQGLWSTTKRGWLTSFGVNTTEERKEEKRKFDLGYDHVIRTKRIVTMGYYIPATRGVIDHVFKGDGLWDVIGRALISVLDDRATEPVDVYEGCYNLTDDRWESMREQFTTLTQERDQARRDTDVVLRRKGDALHRIDALTEEKDNTEIKVTVLTEERDSAKQKVIALTAERDIALIDLNTFIQERDLALQENDTLKLGTVTVAFLSATMFLRDESPIFKMIGMFILLLIICSFPKVKQICEQHPVVNQIVPKGKALLQNGIKHIGKPSIAFAVAMFGIAMIILDEIIFGDLQISNTKKIAATIAILASFKLIAVDFIRFIKAATVTTTAAIGDLSKTTGQVCGTISKYAFKFCDKAIDVLTATEKAILQLTQATVTGTAAISDLSKTTGQVLVYIKDVHTQKMEELGGTAQEIARKIQTGIDEGKFKPNADVHIHPPGEINVKHRICRVM